MQHTCVVCQGTFARSEHLKRHMIGHNNEKPFKCQHCGKQFSRRDTLNRHELIHRRQIGDSDSESHGAASFPSRVMRACVKCAAARIRCTGNDPCERCHKKSFECQYPDPILKGNSEPSGAETVMETLGTTEMNSVLPISESHFATDLIASATQNEPGYDAQAETGMTSTAAFTSWNTYRTITPSVDRSIARLENPGQPDEAGMTGSFDAAFFDQNIFSDLNWLPLTFSAPFYEEPGLSPSFPHQLSNPGASFQFYGNSPHIGDHSVIPGVNTTNSTEAHSIGPAYSGDGIGHESGLASPYHSTVLSQAESPAAHSRTGIGNYYVDGGGGRLSVGGKRRKLGARRQSEQSSSLAAEELRETSSVPSLPEPEQILPHSGMAGFRKLTFIDEEVYTEIEACFSQIYAAREAHTFQPQDAQCLPAKVLDHLIQLAVENFLPVIPVIHATLVNPAETHWIVHLALAAIGSHYLDDDEPGSYVAAAHDFLQKAISSLSYVAQVDRIDNLQLSQAKILSCIGSMYGGNEKLRIGSKPYLADLVEFAGPILSTKGPSAHAANLEISDVTKWTWQAWLQGETLRRTAYVIWLLDCMMAYHLDLRARFTLEDAQTPLPCEEALWSTSSPKVWEERLSSLTATPSLCTAAQILYVEKKCQGIGEFGRILLIHALFQQTWAVGKYYSSPFSGWTPSAPKKAKPLQLPQDPTWLPGNPMYSKWRNSACDCLDVLHWAANSTIGAASGVEHPTVLHLHIARVILLTPFDDIRRLAFAKAGEGKPLTNEDLRKSQIRTQRWVKEDQYKARLAMIHAGVLLWHVRRHSANGFYEPDAVLLASLVMWAYGATSPSLNRLTGRGLGPGGGDAALLENGDSISPDFIHLDRPTDDELVQLFVKTGDTMVANITGVGDLRGPKGPERILREGCKLLVTLTSWGISARYCRILTRLADLTQER